MVRNVIKVFARLKKEKPSKKVKLENYVISKSKPEFEDLIIHHSSSELARYSYYQFRYHKVFDQSSSQKEVFDTVAKPVVSSVIHGFNGTIFAYGQTGSGKTYSITGCPRNYDNRGIIPRCIEHIFEYLNQNPDVYTVHLSYLEIYNEIGYDLLNPRQIASKLEEFPRVILLEDGKGVAHLRNLSLHLVTTEKQAMRLLFLGDTNRTIAETPMNEYSSRSHCIFTVYLSNQMKSNGKNVKSKLHIVDLAGSERIRKSTITGTTLNEAKNINLSLHYLEQVILALSSSKKGHIPFRNSMLTFLLKDSLCGNSLTTMLANLAVTTRNIEETISTCRFSRRVSMISTEPTINEEEFDSQHEISILHHEINELKSKLSKYQTNSDMNSYFNNYTSNDDDRLTQEKQEYCKNFVEDFLNFKTEFTDLTNIEMKFCLELIRSKKNRPNKMAVVGEQIKNLENELRLKDEEIFTLKELLELQINNKSVNSSLPSGSSNTTLPSATSTPRYNNELPLFPLVKTKSPRWTYEHDIEDYNNKLQEKYEKAKAIAGVIDQCKQNIINVRTRLEKRCSVQVKEELNAELFHQQDIYRNNILTLREIEKETNHLKFGLQQVEIKLKRVNSGQCREKRYTDIWSGVSLGNNNASGNLQIDYELSVSNPNSISGWRQNGSYTFLSKDYNEPEKEYGGMFPPVNSPITRVEGENIQKKSFLQLLVDEDEPFVHERLEALGNIDENSLQPCNLNVNHGFSQDSSQLFVEHSGGNSDRNHTKLNNNSSISKYKVPPNTSVEVENVLSNEPFLRNLGQRSRPGSSKKVEKQKPRSNDTRQILPEGFISVPGRQSSQETIIFTKPEEVIDPQTVTLTINPLHKETDSSDFRQFMSSIPLTGDKEVDEEIFNFYRSKFKHKT